MIWPKDKWVVSPQTRWAIWPLIGFCLGCGERGVETQAAWSVPAALTAVVLVAILGFRPPLMAPKVQRFVRGIRLSRECRCRLREALEEIDRLKERLVRLDELKTQHLVSISDELRTPIALVLGPIEKLLAEDGLPPGQRRDLEVVKSNARTLLKHVDSMLELAELKDDHRPLNQRPVDLAHLLRTAGAGFDLLAQDNHILFTVVTPEKLVAQVDADKIERVFLVILSNAFHSVTGEGEVECRMVIEDGQAVTTFRDSGPRPSAVSTDGVFAIGQEDPPVVKTAPVDGLGMAVAKNLVELHGGTITVENLAGGQRSVRVTLPIEPVSELPSLEVRSSRGSRANPESRAAHEGNGLQRLPEARKELVETGRFRDHQPLILVIEDDPRMNRFITDTLAVEYRTISARDGEEGLRKALAERPDLIISDLVMPRMNGDEMVRELRKQDAFGEIPVVILTALADEALRFSLLQDYVQDYILKPVRGPILLVRVKNLLKARIREQQLSASEHQLQALAARLVSIQEEERARLALELHDDLNQKLAALSLGLGSLYKQNPEGSAMRDQIRAYEQQLAEVSQQMREIAHRLHPPALQYLGLGAALKSHCDVFSKQTGIHVNFDQRAVPTQIPSGVATCLFRIAQEGLHNVAKHAGTTSAQLTLSGEESQIRLRLVDMGSGFDVAEARTKNGLGLLSMQERIRGQGGTINIESKRRQGTIIDVAIPLSKPTDVDDVDSRIA